MFYTMLLELTFFLLNWVPRRRIPRPRIPRLRIPPFLTRNPNYSPNTPLLLLVVQLLTHSHTFVQSRKKNFCSTIDKLLLLCKFYHQSRVCQMCQKFKIPIFSVKFPLVTSSYLYLYQKIGTFSKFRSPPKTFSVYTMVY